MVYRDRASNLPYLLEGESGGVSLRTFEERLLQGKDHQEMVLLPLLGFEQDVTERGHRASLGQFVQARFQGHTPRTARTLLHAAHTA